MKWLWVGVGLCAVLSQVLGAEPSARVSPPQRLMISVYDSGYALFNEVRTWQLIRGQNVVELSDVPSALNPATVTLTHLGRGTAPELVDCAWWPGMGGGVAVAAERPRLRFRLNAAEEGPLRLTLLYGAEGLSWRANYILLMRERQMVGTLSVRVAVENKVGLDLNGARLRLVETERGGFAAEDQLISGKSRGGTVGGLRYLYGEAEPQTERLAASPALSRAFDVPQPVSVAEGATIHVTLLDRGDLPVTRFYVYDGVKLDRFEKNPRTDWNYGTAYHPIVDSYLEIGRIANESGPVALPRGRLMAAVLRDDGTADVLGFGMVRAAGENEVIRVQMGPARGIRGARERVAYTELTPFREYEESFAISLENDSTEDVEVRVVEHLYRAPVYEIVRSDTEYINTGPQTIEFRPLVKAGGRRSVAYTVRYRW